MTYMPGVPIQGETDPQEHASDRACPKCKAAGQVSYQTWDSSDGAYTDYKYTCAACRHTWWIDGIDS